MSIYVGLSVWRDLQGARGRWGRSFKEEVGTNRQCENGKGTEGDKKGWGWGDGGGEPTGTKYT